MFIKLQFKTSVEIMVNRKSKILFFNSILQRIISFFILSFVVCSSLKAQTPDALYAKDTRAENRTKLYKNIVSHGIGKNLSYPLSDSTEENWTDAFWAMEFIRYKAPWAESKLAVALQEAPNKSVAFQRSLMELLYANYPHSFTAGVEALSTKTTDDKIFAMCAEYLLIATPALQNELVAATALRLSANPDGAILNQLAYRLKRQVRPVNLPPVKDIVHQSFFSNAVVVFSFQRRNRDYPGMVIVRDSAGNFVKDSTGKLFAVQQLARSITNLPSYLTNGNTPQGIFRMFGTAVSSSNFIGPTPNIQLTMPWETSLQHFMNDSSITDTTWTENWYKRLLPASWQSFYPAMESYFAGKAGRTEIIAHGTTIDPAYYQGTPYYPHTPSLGCLCTKEIWDGADGKRIVSDQQQLIDAVKAAGGTNGYLVVIELNDEQRAVAVQDIIPLIK